MRRNSSRKLQLPRQFVILSYELSVRSQLQSQVSEIEGIEIKNILNSTYMFVYIHDRRVWFFRTSSLKLGVHSERFCILRVLFTYCLLRQWDVIAGILRFLLPLCKQVHNECYCNYMPYCFTYLLGPLSGLIKATESMKKL